MQRRYFEYIAGTSRKFWEVTVAGCHVTVRFGRIGPQGQSQTLPLPDEEVARHHAAKLAASKLKKGYVEVPPE